MRAAHVTVLSLLAAFPLFAQVDLHLANNRSSSPLRAAADVTLLGPSSRRR